MSMNDFINMLTPEQKQALLNALTSNNPALHSVPEEVKQESIKEIQASSTPTVNVKEDFIVQRQNNSRRKEPVRARENRWHDDGTEHKDVVTPDFQKTPRDRKPPQKKSVECDVCGTEFKVDPRFTYGEINRCNRCSSSRKR